MTPMYYKVYETDEALRDLFSISVGIYEYTGDKASGENFIEKYSKTVESLNTFPMGFRGVSIEYKGYEIRILPFENYNIFFVVDYDGKKVVILRVLSQKQNWWKILRLGCFYHIQGEAI